MDMLKKIFPVAFKYKDTGKDLAIGIIVHIVVAIIAGILIWLATALTGWIPVAGAIIGWILGLVSSLIGLYALVGIVLEILAFAKAFEE